MKNHIHLLQSVDPKTGGGLASSCLDLSLALNMRGVNSFVYSTYRDLNISDQNLFLFKRKVENPFLFADEIKNSLEKISAGSIHSHGLYMYSSYLASWLHKRDVGPLVVHVHGIFENWILNRSKIKKFVANTLFENYKYSNAEFWRALTDKEAHQIQEFGVKGEIFVMPNGVDLSPIDEFCDSNSKLDGIKKKLLFFGRKHKKKGLIDLINIWYQLPESTLKNWELLIIGPDDGIEDEIRTNLRDDSIILGGSVSGEKKFETLLNCDLFILPSFSEGFSMSILEACAFRKPILITDECNFNEAYRYGALSLGSYERWKSNLDKALNLSEFELKSRGQSLRQLIENKYQWDKLAKQLSQFIQ